MKDIKIKSLLICFLFTVVLFLYTGQISANDHIGLEATPTGIMADGMSTSLITARIFNSDDSLNTNGFYDVTFSLGEGGAGAGGPGGDNYYNFNGIFYPSTYHIAYMSNNMIDMLPPITGPLSFEISQSGYDAISIEDNMDLHIDRKDIFHSAFQARFVIEEDSLEIMGVDAMFTGSISDINVRLRIYAYNFNTFNWLDMGINDVWLGYEETQNTRELVFPNIDDYIQMGSKEMILLYVLEAKDVKLMVDYVELRVSKGGGGGDINSYDFTIPAGDSNSIYYTNMLVSVPPIIEDEVNIEEFNHSMVEATDDAKETFTGAMAGSYSAFRTKYFVPDEIPMEVAGIDIHFRAMDDAMTGGYNFETWLWNGSNWDFVQSDPLGSTYFNYNIFLDTGSLPLMNYFIGGYIDVLFTADMQDRSIRLDYTAMDIYNVSGSSGPVTDSDYAFLTGINPVQTFEGVATIKLTSKLTPGFVTVTVTTEGLISSNTVNVGVTINSTDGSDYGDISGNIYYQGTNYGDINIAAFDNPDMMGNPIAFTMITSLGGYMLYGLPTNYNYYIGAYMDINHNQNFDSGEPSGGFVNNPLYFTGSMNGVDITLEDSVGGNSISGEIYYYNETSSGPFNVKVGAFSDPSFADSFYEEGADTMLVEQGQYYFSGSYNIQGLTDGMYYIGAFIDVNSNEERDMWEPYGIYRCGSGGDGMEGACDVYVSGNFDMDYINFEISDIAVVEACTLRGSVEVSGMPGNPADNVTVELWDSNNSWNENDFTLYSTDYSTDIWMNDGGPDYNFEVSGIYPQSTSYAYFVKVKKPGHIVNMSNYNIYFSTQTPIQYIPELFILNETSGTLTIDPNVLVENGVVFSTKTVTITPDGDGYEDFAYIHFMINDIPLTNFSGAIARVIIDTNKDSFFEVFDWDQVTWDSNGNPWYGTPPQKLTYDELEVIIAQKDWFMDWWIGDEATVTSQPVDIMWEGKDNSWNMLPPGNYKVKLQLCHSPYWDDNYLGASNTDLTIVIDSDMDGIEGYVYSRIGTSTSTLTGARVEVGGAHGYGEAYTDGNGYYFVAGIPRGAVAGEMKYNIHVEKEGFEFAEVLNFDFYEGHNQVPAIMLDKGGNLSGTITLPAPFTAYTDQWGNSVNELWGHVNAWDETTGNYGFTNFQIVSGQSSKTYEISLPPGFYRVEVELFGYSLQVAQNVEITSYGATKDFTIGGTDRNVTVSGTVQIPVAAANDIYVNINLRNDTDMKYAYSGTQIYISTDTASFMIHDVPPSTTYELNLHADGYAEKNIFNVVIGTTDVTLGTYAFSEGGTISGGINGGTPGSSLWINAWSPGENHGAGTSITLPVSTWTISGLINGAQYYIDTWLEGFEMAVRPYIVTAPTDTAVINLQAFGGSVYGIITGEECVPSKVRVSVTGGMTGGMRVESITPIGISSGTFTIDNLGTGEYMLSVNQYDVAPGTSNYMGVSDGLFATLSKMVGVTNGADFNAGILSLYTSASISGTVYISSSTTPLRTAFTELTGKFVEVMPKQMDWMDMTNAYYMAPLTPVGESSATFSVSGLDKGIYVVRPPVNLDSGKMAGKAEVKTVDAGEAANVDLYLTDGYSISGSVNRPLTGSEGMNIELFSAGYNKDSISSYWVDFSSQPTNRTGYFTLGPVSTGSYIIRVWSNNYKEVAKEVSVTGSDVSVAPILLGKGANIKGRLVDSQTGQPVSGINGMTVNCEARPWVEGSYRHTEQWDNERKIDETTGEFRLENLPAGTYVVRVSGQKEDMYGFAAQYKNYAGMLIAGITVPDNAEDIDLGTIKLKEGSTISGKVEDSGGTGIANIRMSAEPASHHGESVRLEAKTDTNGYYTIKGINEDMKYWDVYAAVRPMWMEGIISGYGEKSRSNVTEKSENVNFVLSEANASLSGTISPSGGKSLTLPFEEMGSNMPGAMVLLQEKGKIYNDPMGGIEQITDHDGDFLIEGIVANDYVLKVFSKGLKTHVADITVSGATGLGVIQLVTGKKVQGSIVDKYGKKINTSDVREVVAVTNDFSRFVFGTVNSNSTTNEIESYSVEGLEEGINYYVALVGEGKADVFIDTATVSFAVGSPTDTITKGIIYTDNPPQFIVQAERDVGDDKKFYIEVWSNEPLSERDASDIISVTEGAGTLSGRILSDDKRECSAVYAAASEDRFKIQVTGHDLKGQLSTKVFTIYTGEKGRNEEFINPVTGGNIVIGQGNASGFYLPMGTKVTVDGEDVEDITGLKIFIASIDPDEVGALGVMKKSMSAYSFIVPSLAVKASGAPGEMLSSVYNMEIYLVTGPLAQLAEGETSKVTVEYDMGASTVPVSKLDINYYDEDNATWVKEKASRTIDSENNTISVDVSHFTKYAAFADNTAPSVPVLSANKITGGGGVELDWDASTASDIKYYEVWQSSVEASNPDGGGYYTWLASVTAPTHKYIVTITTGPYFAVKAVDNATTPNMSGFSNQVTVAYSDTDYKMWVYPNPFHPTTETPLTIKYRIPPGSASNVSVDIKIYNLAGELVRDTFSEIAVPGGYVYRATWDAKNESGSYVANGIYMCYIKMGETEIIKKVALLRSQ